MRWFLFSLVLLGAHCFPVQPSHARDLNCKETCRTDSGGNRICRTRCW